jgi:hypothetical protein
MESSSRGFGISGKGFKPLTKCAGLGGNSSSIAAKKGKSVPKKPTTGIFAAKT